MKNQNFNANNKQWYWTKSHAWFSQSSCVSSSQTHCSFALIARVVALFFYGSKSSTAIWIYRIALPCDPAFDWLCVVAAISRFSSLLLWYNQLQAGGDRASIMPISLLCSSTAEGSRFIDTRGKYSSIFVHCMHLKVKPSSFVMALIGDGVGLHKQIPLLTRSCLSTQMGNLPECWQEGFNAESQKGSLTLNPGPFATRTQKTYTVDSSTQWAIPLLCRGAHHSDPSIRCAAHAPSSQLITLQSPYQ